MGKRASMFLMIAIVAVVMLVVLFLINRNTIFQEGNPVPVFKGIWQLMVAGDKYAVVKDEPPVWITKSGEGNHDELFACIENTYGVKFKQKTGIVFKFEGNGKNITVSERQYSRSFQIWEASISPP